MNYFIKQFQNPNGFIVRLLGKTMSWFNRNMHKSVLSALGNFSTLLEIGYGSGTQLEMIKNISPIATCMVLIYRKICTLWQVKGWVTPQIFFCAIAKKLHFKTHFLILLSPPTRVIFGNLH